MGNSGISCVELKGQFKRLMTVASANANDIASCDIDIDYISYDVKIQIGQGEVADANAVKFSSTVDFNLFYPQDNAIGLSASIIAFAGILATMF